MANEEINSYEFYVKNFPNIKFMLDEKHLNQDKNIILIIFYDNDLYQNYLNLKKENDFIKLLKLNFIDVNAFNSEEYGVFMISGDILHRIDLIINNIFNEKGKLSKEEIFELYVNTIYFGDGYYNVYDACHGYFNKEVQDMDLYECTLLAGIPNAPSVYAPTKNPELAKQRQEQVLKKMVKYNFITQKEADNITK